MIKTDALIIGAGPTLLFTSKKCIVTAILFSGVGLWELCNITTITSCRL